MFCGSDNIVKTAGREATINPLLCRRWTCDRCEPLRCAELRRRAYAGQPNTFITLTTLPWWFDSPDERARNAVISWRTANRYMVKEAARDPERDPVPAGPNARKRRRLHTGNPWPNQVRLYGKRLPYLAVMEETKRGEPHLHVLCRSLWIDQEWLKWLWQILTGAYKVEVERVQSTKAVASYVSQYIAKGPRLYEGCKRFWCTQDWVVDPDFEEKKDRPRADWVQRTDAPVCEICGEFRRAGWEVYEERDRAWAAWGWPTEPRAPPRYQ